MPSQALHPITTPLLHHPPFTPTPRDCLASNPLTNSPPPITDCASEDKTYVGAPLPSIAPTSPPPTRDALTLSLAHAGDATRAALRAITTQLRQSLDDVVWACW
ncbi:hypothetical protein K525DRAFT_275259 [Schizophyllum commune Loenen D]|nr:hypothetical protein K525DRAFT_275259 [Schizophyllum commune Loenen D]